MTLKLDDLSRGLDATTEMPIEAAGDTVIVRLLTRAEYQAVFDGIPPELSEDERSDELAVRMLVECLRDADGSACTREMADELVKNNAITVARQIVDAVFKAQKGDAGEG